MAKFNDKHKLLYKFLKAFAAPLSLKLFIKKINNFENMESDKSYILASNHNSYLDPPILASIYAVNFNKKVYFLGKKKLFRTFLGRIFHETVGTIPLDESDKGKSALKTAKKYLQNGMIMGIFPEGGISPTGKLLKGKTGVARLCLSAKVPVLPIAIKGTYELMPIDRFIPKFKKTVTINIGKLMYFDKYYGKKINKIVLRNITNEIMNNIKRLMSH